MNDCAEPDRATGAGRVAAPRLHVRKDKTNPRRLAYLALLLFARPPGLALALVGAALVLAAVAFHGWAAGYLARAGYVERKPELTVRGPYRHNRNPYYVAHLAMDLGFFCLAGLPLLYLLYFPVIFAVYRKWIVGEEPFLAREFGDAYRTFSANVPRWRVRLRPAPPQGPDQRFSWAMYRRNRELARSLAHLALAAGLGLYALFGNPAAAIDPAVRATLLGLVALWLVTHDVYPLRADGARSEPKASEDRAGRSRVSAGWAAAALAVAAAGGALLAWSPAAIWSRFAPPASWIAIAAAAVFAALAVFGSRELLARPIVRWYCAALAVGCLSATLGGLWTAALATLVLWLLLVAGVARIDPGPHGSARQKERPEAAGRSSA